MKVREAKITYKTTTTETPFEMLDSPAKVYQFLADAWEEYATQEQMIVIPLNRKNRAINNAWVRVSVGTATASFSHPREIFRPLILAGAAAFVVAHNHPSGDPAPSSADIRATKQLREAAGMMQIEMIDHVICGERLADPTGLGYYSFAESGLL
jgi:DNA repair protein RadC